MNEIPLERAKGQFPVSIGTSLALEGLFGIHPDNPLKVGETIPYRNYDCICFNMSTLTRNLINSFKTADQQLLQLSNLVPALNNEMTMIANIIEEHSKDRLVCSFYYNDYFKLKDVLKLNNFKTKMTDKQLVNYHLETTVPQAIYQSTFKQEITSLYIKQGRRKNVILTHYPMDLLVCKLPSFDLLESHTGKIKTPTEFSSKIKYGNGEVPFNPITIQVYGDKTGYVLPMDSKTRKAFTEEMNNLGITKLTSEEKFIRLMKKSKNPEIKMLINRLT